MSEVQVEKEICPKCGKETRVIVRFCQGGLLSCHQNCPRWHWRAALRHSCEHCYGHWHSKTKEQVYG